MPEFRIPPVIVHRTLQGVTSPELTPWGVVRLAAPEAWTQTQGEGTVAYVIDTGCSQLHPDLVPNLVLPVRDFASLQDPVNMGPDAVWEPVPSTDVGDFGFHGTHVCGIIAAADNGLGVRGIAPQAKLIAARAIGMQGIGMDYNLTLALNDAAQEREDWNAGKGGYPVVVINCSWGGNSDVPTMAGAIARCRKAGIVVVAAAGNEGTDTVNYPGRDPNVLPVGSVDDKDTLSWFSSTGKAMGLRGIVAPGSGITSTYDQRGWATLSGTSMASPHISGMVCLIQSLALAIMGKFLDVDTVMSMLYSWAKDLGTPGIDNQYGYGIPAWVAPKPAEPVPVEPVPVVPEPPKPTRREVVVRDGDSWMVVDGKEVTLDVAARVVYPGRFLVPMRALAEAFGLNVEPYKDANGVQCARFWRL